MRVVEPQAFKGVKHPKQKKMRHFGFKLTVLIVAGIYVGTMLARPLPALNVTAQALAPSQAKPVIMAWPTYGQASVGAVGYGVLAVNGEQKDLPMASVAKVMTALAVLKKKPLQIGQQGPTLVINQADVDEYYRTIAMDGSNVPVVLGEEITQYEALQALLLPSANNMAHTLVRWAYGSDKDYLAYS